MRQKNRGVSRQSSQLDMPKVDGPCGRFGVLRVPPQSPPMSPVQVRALNRPFLIIFGVGSSSGPNLRHCGFGTDGIKVPWLSCWLGGFDAILTCGDSVSRSSVLVCTSSHGKQSTRLHDMDAMRPRSCSGPCRGSALGRCPARAGAQDCIPTLRDSGNRLSADCGGF